MSDLVARFQAHLPPLLKHLGLELVAVDKSRVLARLEVAPHLGNLNGVMHGGAFMAFADHLGAIGTIVNLPAGAKTATIESKTNFFLPGKIGETLTAESLPLHIGRKTMVWQTRITGPDGRLRVMVTQTQIVLPPERAGEAS
jgi:1,4-dihydroxy-2-naphthoyl-CoA hydrolase